MGGVFPNETSIYIVASGTASSALTAADKIVGEITNIARSGGEEDVESIPVIGGFVDKENPRSQYEINIDVIVQNTATSTLDRYDSYQLGTGLTSAGEGSDKAIFIGHISGGFSKLTGFNNARAISWEPELAADDMLRGSISFKFSPTTPIGVANLKTTSISGSTLPSFNWVS